MTYKQFPQQTGSGLFFAVLATTHPIARHGCNSQNGDFDERRAYGLELL